MPGPPQLVTKLAWLMSCCISAEVLAVNLLGEIPHALLDVSGQVGIVFVCAHELYAIGLRPDHTPTRLHSPLPEAVKLSLTKAARSS